MVRPGKERMAPSEDDAATQMTAQDSRWLNGVNRQLQPDAAEQRVAASRSAASKRKADAMPEDERKRREAERSRLNRKKRAAEKAAAAAAARESAAAAVAAAATPPAPKAVLPTLDIFNGWCAQHCGETIDENEWIAFDDFCIFSELDSDDCNELPFVELFSNWRNSDEYQRYQIEVGCEQLDHDAREPSPPYQPSTSQPHCPECRRTHCICHPPSAAAPDDDDPYQNPGAWANHVFCGNDTPPRSPLPETNEDDYWDNLADREYARQAGELGWWGSNWGEAAQPQQKQQLNARACKQRERHTGPPPSRDEPRFGPRGDAVGDQLFREQRAAWYHQFTGKSIAGISLQEQNELCDAIARRFREYNDGRTEEPQDRRFRTSARDQPASEQASLPALASAPARTIAAATPRRRRPKWDEVYQALPTAELQIHEQLLKVEVEQMVAFVAEADRRQLETFPFECPRQQNRHLEHDKLCMELSAAACELRKRGVSPTAPTPGPALFSLRQYSGVYA